MNSRSLISYKWRLKTTKESVRPELSTNIVSE